MSFEAFAPLMFAGLVGTLLIGFPVAFSLAALGLLCGLIAIEMGIFPVAFMGNLPLNVLGILSNDLLLAIPFFTLMGAILEKCGLAEDLLDSMGQLFGPMRGGLGYSVIVVGFSVRTNTIHVYKAKAVLLAAGGCVNLFRPRSVGEGAGRAWYPVWNAGSTYAMAAEAGAEMTMMENRFVPARFRSWSTPSTARSRRASMSATLE